MSIYEKKLLSLIMHIYIYKNKTDGYDTQTESFVQYFLKYVKNVYKVEICVTLRTDD